jgi:hypothetical protein
MNNISSIQEFQLTSNATIAFSKPITASAREMRTTENVSTQEQTEESNESTAGTK